MMEQKSDISAIPGRPIPVMSALLSILAQRLNYPDGAYSAEKI
jgi:hypothetical protein